jgi:uracil-DNA glycosylase family 4
MQRGEPFVGQAGKLLDNMLAAIRLRRGEMSISPMR